MVDVDVEEFVRLAFATDACLDFVCEPIPVEDSRRVLRWIVWPGFRHDAVSDFLASMKPGTVVSIGRSQGPLLEIWKPGMKHGGIRGMFKRAVEAAGGAEALGYSRVLVQWHGYMLLWNDE